MTQTNTNQTIEAETETQKAGNRLAAKVKIRIEKFTDVVNLLHAAEKAFRAKDLDTGERFLQHAADRLNRDD